MFIENYLNNRDKSNSKKSYIIVFYIICAFLLYATQINTAFAGTGVNQQIPYSGSLVNNAGVALSDGSTYRAKFVLWDALSGGTQIYEEIRDGITVYPGTGVSPALSINDGRFDILLGSQNTTLPTILNNDTLYLEIRLDMDNNGSYEEVFAPRRRIGSAVSAINSLRLVTPPGGVDTDTLSLDVAGNVIATSLGGVANGAADFEFDRVLLANNLGQFSQVNISTLGGGGSGWNLLGNNTTSAWNGTTGSYLGTTSAQPLVLATTNATAQDIRFFTGANGANERLRINSVGNIGINTTPSPTDSNYRALEINGGSLSADNTGSVVFLTNNVYWNGTDWIARNTGVSSAIGVGSGQLSFSTAISATAGTASTLTNKMLLLNNGDLVIGNGDTSGTPTSPLLRATNGSGTNIPGGAFTIVGGQGTGTGIGGSIVFQTAPAGLTGSTLNAAVERLRIQSDGNVGIGAAGPVAKLDVNTNALVNPTINPAYAQSGISLSNSTVATTGNQQFSPTLRWRGSGFATTPVAGRDTSFISYLQPVQGATDPTANLIFASSINNAAYTTRLTLNSGGTLTVAGGVAATTGVFSGAVSGTTGTFSGAVSATTTLTTTRNGIITTSTDGKIITNTTAATAGVPVQISPRIRLSGTAWNTTPTAASNTINWAIENIPISGAVPSSSLRFNFDRNNTGYSTVFSLLSGGNLGLGVLTPTARLNLAAGTATANTAPFKFTAGTNLTTPEAGALEWDGTNLFLTTSGAIRQTINQGLTGSATLDFPSTANDSFSTLTVAVANTALNDVVSLGLPNGSVPAAATDFQAWVSVAGTVTVRFTNNSGVAQDPASGTFKVFVTKF